MTTKDITRIELTESSGPVSPRYQYALALVITRGADGTARVSCKRTGAGAVTFETTMDAASVSALFGDLAHAGIEGAHGDFVDAARGNKGVSFNALVITFADGTTTRCDYLLTSLDEPDFPARSAIERLHAVARESHP